MCKGFCLCFCPIDPSEKVSFWPKTQLSRSVFWAKSVLVLIYSLSFSTLHCTQSIQLENDDSTDRIHLLRVTQLKSPQSNARNMTKDTYISQTSKNTRSVLCRNFWYLMSSRHDSSYQSIFGSKITDYHPTFMTETAERQILPQLWVV